MLEFFIRAILNSFFVLSFFAIVKFKKDEETKTRQFRSTFFALFAYIATFYLFFTHSQFPSFSEAYTSLLVGCVLILGCSWYIFHFIEWVRKNLDDGPPFFRLFGSYKLVPFDKRVTLIFLIWVLTLLITSFMLTIHSIWPNLIGSGFVVSWVGDVAFFSLVGIAVALAGIRLPHTESFDTRLSILFSGNKSEAMQATRNKVRALGFYVSDLRWKAQIKEYSQEYDAVLVEMNVTSTLVNLFGDVDAEDKMKFEIKPDEFIDVTPTPIGQITSMHVDSDNISVSRITSPIDIEATDGAVIDEEFTVKDKPVSIQYTYWIWAKIGAVWSHKPHRFTEKAMATITNSIQPGNLSVEIDILNLSAPESTSTLRTLKFNERCQTTEERSMTSETSYPLFKILQPSETTEIDAPKHDI